MTDRLIRITTALAVVAVAVVAAIISYQHAYELVRSHGESGMTARLLPFTVDGLIWAASMVILNASRRNRPVPRLAAWSSGQRGAPTVLAVPDGTRRMAISARPPDDPVVRDVCRTPRRHIDAVGHCERGREVGATVADHELDPVLPGRRGP